jgi:hypothetical protein
MYKRVDSPCGLVDRVPGYRSRGPGSIPGPTRFSGKCWVWNGVHSVSWVQLRSYLKEKSSGSGLENREYGSRDPSRWPRGTIHPQKLALTLPTSGGRSVGIVRSRTRPTEFFISEPHGATRRQAIAKIPAKWSAYQIPSATVVFVVLVFKVQFASLISKSHNRPWTY